MMKSVRATIGSPISPALALNWLRKARNSTTAARLFTRDGSPSVDGLDAAIRAFGVAIAIALSIFNFGKAFEAAPTGIADPIVVAAGLVAYNLVIIVFGGVPWRRAPGFTLFVLDWLVASSAILLTGGFPSPFNILYYALIIGAALRIGLGRSSVLVGCCAIVYVFLSLVHPEPDPAVRLPILVVQITTLAMVMFTSVGMRRVVQVEARKVELEEVAARQLRLLNNLTTAVLGGELDLEHVGRTIASVSSQALQAERGLAVLFSPSYDAVEEQVQLPGDGDLLLVSNTDRNPAALSSDERLVLEKVTNTGQPAVIQNARASIEENREAFPSLQRDGEAVGAVACVPFLLGGRAIGALFVGRRTARPFTAAEVSLLTAISQQMAVSVRLARLYDLEREKAVRSEERERLERDLLSTVSHELRTPLTSIKTCVGALAETRPGESRRADLEERMLNNIDRSTERLIGLVDELLDMSRLRAGRVSLNLQQINLGELLSDTAAQVAPLLQARQQSISLDLPAVSSPRWNKLNVLGDRRRLEQVLFNLLSNAQKFGPQRSKIVLGATPRDGQVRVFVRDEGPGIARFEHRLIFDKFYSGSAGISAAGGAGERPESTGLGLAIARSIVELHGGRIGVFSRLGGGSTFFFSLASSESVGPGEARAV